MFGVLLQNLIHVFLTKSSSPVSSIIQTSPNLSCISLSHSLFLIAHKKSRILFQIQIDVLKPPETLLNHTFFKLCYLIHELYPTNHLSLQELINYGTPCFPLPSLNPTTCLVSNQISTSLILSICLLNFSFSSFVTTLY